MSFGNTPPNANTKLNNIAAFDRGLSRRAVLRSPLGATDAGEDGGEDVGGRRASVKRPWYGVRRRWRRELLRRHYQFI